MMRRQPGFALVITLVLLALLVLAVFALSALTKVSGDVATTSVYQTQARQNALLGLSVALGELQRHAGDDTRITGMAGITGLAASAPNTTRNWCGVWRNDGSFVAWLASGAQPSAALLQAGAASVELIGQGSVGAAAANSEHVVAGRVPIAVTGLPSAPDATTEIGGHAYLVSDEGVKTAAYAPAPVLAIPPVIYATSAGTAQGRLRDALANNAANAPKVLSYEQLALLPTPGSTLTPSTLQDNFHHVTLTNRIPNGLQPSSGAFNVNTNSAIAWRNLLQTYNSSPAASAQISSANISARGTTIQNGIAAYSGAGKSVNGPFTSTTAFATYLATLFPITGSPNFTQIMTIIGPMLAVRSDTFRIRAYGDAVNPLDPAKVESSAYCEAIVQRVKDSTTSAGEGRFIITYFRWLGPDDI